MYIVNEGREGDALALECQEPIEPLEPVVIEENGNHSRQPSDTPTHQAQEESDTLQPPTLPTRSVVIEITDELAHTSGKIELSEY